MVVMNKLVAALVVIIVLVLLLITFYSGDGLFSKIKEKVLGIGDNVPGVEVDDVAEGPNDQESSGS
jgi:hypothetical protein